MLIGEDVCDVWLAALGDFSGTVAEQEALLSADELAEVRRTAGSRTTVRLSRAVLRLLLARYLGLAPAEVQIDRSCPSCDRQHGKPRLVHSAHPTGPAFEFSVAHGGDLLVLAFAGCAVGVDVERSTSEQSDELQEFALTPQELLRVRQLPTADRGQEFLRLWTGKEAVLKALGTGLDLSPQAVALADTTLVASPLADPSWATLPGELPVAFWVCDVEVGPGHVCSLATGRRLSQTRLNRLPARSLGMAGP